MLDSLRNLLYAPTVEMKIIFELLGRVLICGLRQTTPSLRPINGDYAVSTGSDSDRVAIHATVDFCQDNDPVATAPGTDLILKFLRALSALETMKVGEIIRIEE